MAFGAYVSTCFGYCDSPCRMKRVTLRSGRKSSSWEVAKKGEIPAGEAGAEDGELLSTSVSDVCFSSKEVARVVV